MKTPHKHAELIKEWACGEEIQWFDESDQEWWDTSTPSWKEGIKFRIKPEPNVVTLDSVQLEGDEAFFTLEEPNLKLTWCGETGKLKSAEVL